MKVLLTGGSGFIGRRIRQSLEGIGYEVLSYDLPDYDIRDEEQFRLVLNNYDMVIHCAAMADITKCIVLLDDTFDVNVRATYHIAKQCMLQDKPLVFISTCCVYGNSFDDVEMEGFTAPHAAEPYACSKVAGEALIHGMPNLRYVILRIGTVYGVGMREALFTFIALNNIRNGQTVYIDGDGSQTRQLVYIDDLIDGITKAVVNLDDVVGETFNLCGIEYTSAVDTVDVAEKIVGKPAIRVNREQRYGQTFHENISIDCAGKLLGWEPKTTFYEGMKYAYENDPRFR
jgi:UDP-glucose 4-epimerase